MCGHFSGLHFFLPLIKVCFILCAMVTASSNPTGGALVDLGRCSRTVVVTALTARWNTDKPVLENHTLTQAEDERFRKHEFGVGLAFFVFVLGCFGGKGSQAFIFLCTLASLPVSRQVFSTGVYGVCGGFGQGYCHASYWSSFSSSTYLPPSSTLYFQWPG